MTQRPMRSLTEVREHLSGDRITCLICGKPFRAVCHHARLAHGISARDYKQRFGLPVSRGVATPDARAAWGASITKTRLAGGLPDPEPPPAGQRGSLPPYTRDMPRIDPRMAAKLFDALRAGHTITEACGLPGMPKWTWFHKRLQRDPALQADLDELIEGLPFGQQARMKKLGARFAAEVAARRGLTAAAISHELGVSEEAVRRQIIRNARV